MKPSLMLFALVAFALRSHAASPTPQAEPLQAVAANAPAIMIAAHTAARMKQELDHHALFVDVDSTAGSGATLRVDAHVPLHVYDAPETYDDTFMGRIDAARAAKRLRFTDGVVVVSRSARTALEAAELMREHGYALVFAVTSP
jgi:hypothetical protein